MPAKESKSSNLSTTSTTARRVSSSAESQTQGEEPRPKRRKIAKACDECRQRKSRCDGARPCGPCAKKGRNASRCTYQQDLAASISQSYIEELESRIRLLEGSAPRHAAEATNEVIKAVFQSTEGNNVSPGMSKFPAGAEYNTTSEPTRTDNSSARTLPTIANLSPTTNRMDSPYSHSYPGSAIHRRSSTVNEGVAPTSHSTDIHDNDTSAAARTILPPLPPPPPKDRADAMGATSPADGGDGDNGPSGFFGSSSTISFMKQIKNTVTQKLISSASPPDRMIFAPNSGSESSETVRRVREDDDFMDDLQDFILPPRSIADHLVDCYWTSVHTLYPFLHRIEFMKVYDSLWAAKPASSEHGHPIPRQRPPGRLFRCILNLVFAFGCQLSTSIAPSRRESSADVFLKRARELLHFDVLDSGSIELVQALALMGQYLQSTKYPNRCWNVVGLAIRVAQGLGMHLDSTSQNRGSIIEREMWRRTWHGCIVLDRIVSMTFGRPSMIPVHSKVTLPMEIDDEYLTDDVNCMQPADSTCRMSFFICTLKLYDILGEILSVFYGGSNDPKAGIPFSDRARAEEDYQAVMRLDRALLDFQMDLPPHLQFRYFDERGEPLPREPVFLRQANILHSRYLNIRILLFRPVIIHLIQESQSTDYLFRRAPTTLLEATLAIKCSVSCVAAAQESIALLDENLISGAVPAWWYYIFYLYTSATILLAAKLCPTLNHELDYSSMEVSWKRCIEILRGVEGHYDSARRCLATLEAMHEQIISPQQTHQPAGADMTNGKSLPLGQTGAEGIPHIDGVVMPNQDPLLQYNTDHVWESRDMDFGWFFENPMWNSPDFATGSS